jgi:hypothetical protein
MGQLILGYYNQSRHTWYECNGISGYTNNNYAGDIDDIKSISGYVFMMGQEIFHCHIKNNL